LSSEEQRIRRARSTSSEPNVSAGSCPTSGNTYTCQPTLDGDDRLRLGGYVGVPLIGRTTTRTRVGAENRLCAEGR